MTALFALAYFAAAAVVRRADGQMLLHRRKGDVFWALPGGAIEPGESASPSFS